MKYFMLLVLPVIAQAAPDFLKPATPEARLEYLAKASIWESTDVESMDLFQGPAADLSFNYNASVECDFDAPGEGTYSGVSPKFRCRIGDTKVKVKYFGPEGGNREVFAEVAATRLFWALGFYADRMYPVQMTCHGCPEDPNSGKGPIATRTYPYATIERKHEGLEIQTKPDQGWTFQEVEKTTKAFGSELNARQIHSEALKLLSVFIQHGDRKAQQQRLSCPKDALTYTKADLRDQEFDDYVYTYIADTAELRHCSQAQILIQDLGATFGGAGWLSKSIAKMSVSHWRDEAVFNEKKYHKTFNKKLNAGVCEGNIKVSLRAGNGKGVGDPIIREEGRVFLFDLLTRFKKTGKIPDLFNVANAEALAAEDVITVPTREGSMELRGVEAWAYAFNEKLDQIASHRCCRADANGNECIQQL